MGIEDRVKHATNHVAVLFAAGIALSVAACV